MSYNNHRIFIQHLALFLVKHLVYILSEICNGFIYEKIDTNSSNLKSAKDSVTKNVDMPNWFAIANTWCNFYFPINWSTLDRAQNIKCLFLAISCLTVCLKLLRNIPAVNVSEAAFLIVVFMWLFNWVFCGTESAKKQSLLEANFCK